MKQPSLEMAARTDVALTLGDCGAGRMAPARG